LETTLTTGMIFTILIAQYLRIFPDGQSDDGSALHLGCRIGNQSVCVMLLICLVYIILGCLMDGQAIMILTCRSFTL